MDPSQGAHALHFSTGFASPLIRTPNSGRLALNRENPQQPKKNSKIIDFLRKLAQLEEGISDIHLATGCPPIVRIDGTLRRVSDRRMSRAEIDSILGSIIPNPEISQKIKENRLHDYDFSYGIAGVSRFRVNVFFQRNTPALVMRKIAVKIPSIQDLGLPPILTKVAQHERGLVLVTGVTGSGKSSTLASMIDYINTHLDKHIITIEDPVEYLHRDKKSVIRQREVWTDTDSFSIALRAALRQDPDVILVGEMRDAETISVALQAAETGHLVFSTLHTQSAVGTINRILDTFEGNMQQQVRLQLAENIQAVISQRLLRRKDGKGRVAAVEVMIGSLTIREYIKNPDKTNLIFDIIEDGGPQYGMQTFDQHLTKLFVKGVIDFDSAIRAASRPTDFVLKLQEHGFNPDTGRFDPAPEQEETEKMELQFD